MLVLLRPRPLDLVSVNRVEKSMGSGRDSVGAAAVVTVVSDECSRAEEAVVVVLGGHGYYGLNVSMRSSRS